MKRSLIIAGIVFVVLIIGVVVYFIFFASGAGNKTLKNLFPFGKPDISNDQPGTVEKTNTSESSSTPQTEKGTSTLEAKGPGDFILISSDSVAGFEPLIKKSEDGDIKRMVRYIERNNGYIYQIDLIGKNKTRLSSARIQNIHDAFWEGDGNYLIFRSLANNEETITSYLVNLSNYKKSEGGRVLEGKVLPKNIEDVAILEDSEQALFITPSDVGVLVSTLDFSTQQINELFSSAFSEWLLQWPKAGKVALTTKASYAAKGYLYSLIPGTGDLEKVLGGIKGFTTLVSPDFKHVLYSESVSGGMGLYLYNVKTKGSLRLSTATLPEKCVWKNNEVFYCAVPKNIPSAKYPDDWYQGQIEFSDNIVEYKVGSPNPTRTLRLDPPVDATRLAIEEKYLYFIDRKTGFLWALRVEEDE